MTNLATRQVISRNRVQEYPVTDLFIKAVDKMATEQVNKNLNWRDSISSQSFLQIGLQELTTKTTTTKTKMMTNM